MKTVFYNPKGFLMAFIVFGLSIMHAQELQRSINKNFPLKAGGKLHIENSYGTVKLNSWDKNEVAIEVTISVKGGTSERAEELLEDIDILFNTSTDEVRAITQLPEKIALGGKTLALLG